MPVSEKRLLANRRNAKLCTGPKTPKGKATSSRNATKHGLYSDDLIVKSKCLKEDQNQYDKFVINIQAALKPDGPLQEYFVIKIANCLWLGRRAAEIRSLLNTAPISTLPTEKQMKELLKRFGSRHYRQINQNLVLLRSLQKASARLKPAPIQPDDPCRDESIPKK